MSEQDRGVSIKTYVVLDALGRVRGVKLNKKSAVSLLLALPPQLRGAIQLHHADKVVHTES